MTPARLFLGLLATFAVAGLVALGLRGNRGAGPETRPESATRDAEGAPPNPARGTVTGVNGVRDPQGEAPAAESPRTAIERNESLQRMTGIGRKWLQDLAVESSLTESQKARIWKLTEDFIKSYEELRRLRGPGGDQRAFAALYDRANESIRDILGVKGKGWHGLPTDWGFGDGEPGPGR